MFAPEFVLKTTPPRASRSAVERPPLQQAGVEALQRAAVIVVAPAGFGKTTLLTQWRSMWLKHNALVAWLTGDGRDDPRHFTLGLLHAVRSASGKPVFDALLAQYAGGSERHIEGLTALLRELAHLGTETVLVIDDAERLPQSTVRESVQYLVRNAPQNLHVVIGSRVPLPLETWDLSAKGSLATIGMEELRLGLDQSIAILGRRFNARLGVDDCARLHDLVEGWPLGLQLAAATMEHAPDLVAAVDAISARDGDIERYFFELLLTRVPARVAEFLVHVAMLGHLNAALCEAVTGSPAAGAYLSLLMVETPVLCESGLQGWLRLHPLARDFLMGRFERLPLAERQQLHARASDWFAEREQFHEAACHALESGNAALAQQFAARALWTLTVQGQLLEAREWLDQIPSDALATDIDLRLVGAWINAIGEYNATALDIAQAVVRDPGMSPHRRFVAARAAFTAVAYGDRLGLMQDILACWHAFRPPSSLEDPVQMLAYQNGHAFLALQSGDTQQVRQLAGRLPPGLDKDSLRLPVAHRLMIVGLSHLWDGNADRCETSLWPALANAERITGRRGMVASFIASLVAAALLEQDQPAAAQAMLANRLDIIERVGAPDVILLAYRTLAYASLAEGDERRALDLLEALGTLAKQRNFPRLELHALAEQLRVHAIAGRVETVDRLMHRLQALEVEFANASFAIFQPLHALTTAIAATYAGLAHGDADACASHLEAADRLANALHRGRDIVTVKVLRGLVAHRRREPGATPLLAEALSLAAMGGCNRVLADTHPRAVQLARELGFAPAIDPASAAMHRRPPDVDRGASRGGLLTSKEAEVLQLLGNGLSNKRIARALEISDETVKWHVKNLFVKLEAGTRQHAVGRARLLGLLAN